MSTPALLCMGEPMLELNRQPPDAESRALYLEGHGGDTSNAAIAAARSGASVGYITAIGSDAAGQSFLDLWKRENVDTATVTIRPDAPTGLYLVTHGPQGHEFTFYRTNSAAAQMTPADIPEAAIRAARILHVSGISQAISATACDAVFHAIHTARAAGTLVSYDTNLRLRLWPAARAAAIIHAALALSDIALPSLDDARTLTGLDTPDAIADFYLTLCPTVLLKLGAQGALCATRTHRTHIPAHPVTPIDATGAGDCFAGAFLARHLAGDTLEDATRYATIAAALSTTGFGAVAPIPTAEAVLAARG
ncbi:sugar kinase [Plastoroseomonas arctica]|uniref:Sugar kinase n=1 Tax=Plastoroseomonas arctica TaxID=1509237 RepID=A0AAF1KM90_9PROT|nr:sugar kinase [Plastoroseomonas arctica]MBR0656021.1 sugar kinase [Plastoroseomonas arctica]